MEKLKVIVRLRPFSRRERATCGEEEVRVVDGMVQLGRQPGYALSEPPNSVGRQLAQRVASNIELDVETPPDMIMKRLPFGDQTNNAPTPELWEELTTPPAQTKKPAASASTLPSRFRFDGVYGPDASTEALYDGSGVSEIVQSFTQGYNATIFAYGQTGSGKTHTMEGITDLAVEDVFAFVEASRGAGSRHLLRASVLEVYNEKIHDLLAGGGTTPGEKAANLRLLEDTKSVKVQGLAELSLDTRETLQEALQRARLSRMTASTKANERSSRSHLVVRLTLETRHEGSRMLQVSCLNLVDLAGSERVQETQASMRETCSINQSLLCLGNVVARLAEDPSGHVPYRDSKLTRLLQHALGGNSKTAMICTISPCGGWHLEQSKGTLMFASRAMNITNAAKRNLEAEEDLRATSLLMRYEKEIEDLRFRLEGLEHEHSGEDVSQVQELKRKLEGMTKFVLNYFDGETKTLTTPRSGPPIVNKHGQARKQKVYTTLGLMSPSQEGARSESAGVAATAQLFSPLLEKYREARRKQQQELGLLQGHVASLKEGRAKDKALLQKQLEDFEAEMTASEKELAKYQDSIASKDALLSKNSDQIGELEQRCARQAKEIANLKLLNERLCAEANKSREERNAETERLQEAERQRAHDIKAAEESALALEGQIAALEVNLDKIGTKAAMVSPAVRRVKELEEQLEVKIAQLKNVEEKVVEKSDAGDAKDGNQNLRMKNNFDSRKLLRFSAMLETALAKMQGWTGVRELAASPSPNTPRLPPRSLASITWEHGKDNQSPRTPENVSELTLTAFRKQELGHCINEAVTSCRLFKEQVECLYSALQEAEEANDGQQILLTVVAQEHAKKTTQWEMEVAKLKGALNENSALASLERHSKEEAEKTLHAKMAEMENVLASVRDMHAQEMRDMVSLLQKREATLLNFTKSEELYQEKLKSVGQKQKVILDETLQFREEELRAEAAKELEDALTELKVKLEKEKRDACDSLRETLQGSYETRIKNLQEQQANMSFEFDSKLESQESQLAEDMVSALAKQETELKDQARTELESSLQAQMESLRTDFARELNQALVEQKVALSVTTSQEGSRALQEQKESLEALAQTKLETALADLTESLSMDKANALDALRESLEKEFDEALQNAVDSKAREAEAAIRSMKEAHADQFEEMVAAHSAEMEAVRKELAQVAEEEKASMLIEQKQELEMSMDIKARDLLERQEIKLQQAFDEELSTALARQRVEMEVLGAERESDALSSLTADLIAEKNSALSALQETLERQFSESLEQALDSKAAEADATLASLRSGHANQLDAMAEAHTAEMERLRAELSREAEEELARAVQEERTAAETKLSTAVAAFGDTATEEKAQALEGLREELETALLERIAEVEARCEAAKEEALDQQRSVLEEEGARALDEALVKQETLEQAIKSFEQHARQIDEEHSRELEGKAFEHEEYQRLVHRCHKLEEKLARHKGPDLAVKIDFHRTASILKRLDFNDGELCPEMQKIVKLWRKFNVPLYHRARFFGTQKNSLLRENKVVLGMELQRLQWMKEALTQEQLRQAAKDLELERADLLQAMRSMKASTKEAMLAAWGYKKDDRRRKASLVERIFAENTSAAASSTVVLYLSGGDRKSTFMHFCSLYTMHNTEGPDSSCQSSPISPMDVHTISFGEGQEDAEPIILDLDLEEGLPRTPSRTASLKAKVFTPLKSLFKP